VKRYDVDGVHIDDYFYPYPENDASGKPIDDADVSVQLFMPAMPTMNMPPMRSETKLNRAGGGAYRGSGQVMMAGRWDVTVTVARGGQRLGAKQLPVLVR